MNPPQALHNGQLGIRRAAMTSLSSSRPRPTTHDNYSPQSSTKRQCLASIAEQQQGDARRDRPAVRRSSLLPLSDASAIDFKLSALLLQGDGTERSSHYAVSALEDKSASSAAASASAASAAKKRSGSGSSATPALDSRIDALLGRIHESKAARRQSTYDAVAAATKANNSPALALTSSSSSSGAPLSSSSSRTSAIDAAILAVLNGKRSGILDRGEEKEEEKEESSNAFSSFASSSSSSSAVSSISSSPLHRQRMAWERDAAAVSVSSVRLTERADERRRVRQLEETTSSFMAQGSVIEHGEEKEQDMMDLGEEEYIIPISDNAKAKGSSSTTSTKTQEAFLSWGHKSLPTDLSDSQEEEYDEIEVDVEEWGVPLPPLPPPQSQPQRGDSNDNNDTNPRCEATANANANNSLANNPLPRPGQRSRSDGYALRAAAAAARKQRKGADSLDASVGGGDSTGRVPISHPLQRNAFAGNVA